MGEDAIYVAAALIGLCVAFAGALITSALDRVAQALQQKGPDHG